MLELAVILTSQFYFNLYLNLIIDKNSSVNEKSAT